MPLAQLEDAIAMVQAERAVLGPEGGIQPRLRVTDRGEPASQWCGAIRFDARFGRVPPALERAGSLELG